jgi:hypothetical protein
MRKDFMNSLRRYSMRSTGPLAPAGSKERREITPAVTHAAGEV